MPSASHTILVDFFEHHLHFTPTPGQVHRFERDLALVSPDLMRAALKEAAANRGLAARPFEAKRAAILTAYYRKVAEHARLFPVFHTFETAFRSTVAVDLETHYGRATWWGPALTAVRAGGSADTLPHLYGVALPKNTANLLDRVIAAIDRTPAGHAALTAAQSGYAFTDLCELSHIGDLVLQHWSSVFEPRYFAPPHALTRSDFAARFKLVREARNTVYHHRSLAGMTKVVTAAETLLDHLGCSLDFATEAIRASKGAQPRFSIAPANQDNLF